MYSDTPQLIADRNINPKLSDVYNLFNKWRKNNLGECTGKELFTEELENKGANQPLILVIFTPLMARVHQYYIQQSGELVFVDTSTSFEDYNNLMFVVSTSSAAGGLPEL